MHTTHHQLRAAIVAVLLTGILLTSEASVKHLSAQISSGGATLQVPATVERPIEGFEQGPMHGAAPIIGQTPFMAHAELFFGMVLILAGFILSLYMVRSERSVHITIKKGRGQRLALQKKQDKEWFWVKLEI